MKRNSYIFYFLSFLISAIFFIKLNDSQFQVYYKNWLKVSSESEEKFYQMTESFYGYAAYFDEFSNLTSTSIRIIGIDEPQNYTQPVSCLFFNEQKLLIGSSSGQMSITKDPYVKSHLHTLAFVLCEHLEGTNPTFVALEGFNHDNKLKIIYPPKQLKYNVSSCIKPMHSFYESPLLLIEWLEYHILLGVEHFTFYNFSAGPLTSAVLKSYPEIVKVLDWKVPFPGKGNPVFGQLVSVTECAHRYRGNSKFVLNLDIDEFLVPFGFIGSESGVKNISEDGKVFEDENEKISSNGYHQFLDTLWELYEEKSGKRIHALRFESKFSFENSPKKELNYPGMKEDEAGILSKLRITTRNKFLDAGQKKFVYRPSLIIESGIHFTPFAVQNTVSPIVSKAHGYYLHFRDCQKYYHKRNQILKNNATCLQSEGFEEDSYVLDNLGPILAFRVMRKLEELKKSGIRI